MQAPCWVPSNPWLQYHHEVSDISPTLERWFAEILFFFFLVLSAAFRVYDTLHVEVTLLLKEHFHVILGH